MQAVVNELQGEKIDIIPWSPDIATFVVNALAPAEVAKVVLDEEKTLHELDDPALAEHVRRAGEAFRSRALKREYFATLPDGAAALDLEALRDRRDDFFACRTG